jgi:hypothetical protein
VPFFTIEEIEKLISKAKALSQQDMRYGYVTVFDQPTTANSANDLDSTKGHLENLDLLKLANLNLNNVPSGAQTGPFFCQDGQFCTIGDRNWVGDGYPRHLGVAKMKIEPIQSSKMKKRHQKSRICIF